MPSGVRRRPTTLMRGLFGQPTRPAAILSASAELIPAIFAVADNSAPEGRLPPVSEFRHRARRQPGAIGGVDGLTIGFLKYFKRLFERLRLGVPFRVRAHHGSDVIGSMLLPCTEVFASDDDDNRRLSKKRLVDRHGSVLQANRPRHQRADWLALAASIPVRTYRLRIPRAAP